MDRELRSARPPRRASARVRFACGQAVRELRSHRTTGPRTLTVTPTGDVEYVLYVGDTARVPASLLVPGARISVFETGLRNAGHPCKAGRTGNDGERLRKPFSRIYDSIVPSIPPTPIPRRPGAAHVKQKTTAKYVEGGWRGALEFAAQR